MVNLPKPRKVQESKNLLKLSKKKKAVQLKIESNFAEILDSFMQCFSADQQLVEKQNREICTSIRQLLSSLQSLLNRQHDPETVEPDSLNRITESVVDCSNKLNSLITDIILFPETTVLTALCLSFLQINYFCYFHSEDSILSAIDLYFDYFDSNHRCSEEFLKQRLQMNSVELEKVHFKILEIIDSKLASRCTFREVALLSGFLNCSVMSRFLISQMADIFVAMFSLVHKLCFAHSNHEFHVHRLLNGYLKLLYDFRPQIEANRGSEQFSKDVAFICKQTMGFISNNWESPINGVNNSTRQTYSYLIQLCKFYSKQDFQLQEFLIEQFAESLNLPFTCKAKYRKLAILIQTLSTEDVDVDKLNRKLGLNSTANLCQFPFQFDSNFAFQTVQHLSINSLSNSIAEMYKSSIVSIVDCCKNSSLLIEDLWSSIWLQAIKRVFSNSSTVSSSTVVHNTLLAHILPFTIENIPNCLPVLLDAFVDCTYAQVSVVRIYLEKCSSRTLNQLPPRTWLVSLLTSGDDLTRAEGISLLIDEKFISKDRVLICQLVKRFILNNLNIDNASFRQKIICKLEKFYKRLFHSFCDRFDSQTPLSKLNSNDKEILKFLNDTFNILSLSFAPGSSFQRKFTALSILSSLLELINAEDASRTMASLMIKLSEDGNSRISLFTFLLYGLIDKDDKIRRLTAEVMIQYSKSSLADSFDSRLRSEIQEIAIYFLKSFRHQECHIGALLQKFLFRTNLLSSTESIEYLVFESRKLFYSKAFHEDLLQNATKDSLHGWILALNHCLTFDSFFEGYIRGNGNLQLEPLRRKIFKPILALSFDCLDFFLNILCPPSGEVVESEFTSPSFFDMCQSIQNVIKQENFLEQSEDISDEDIFLTNDFQLILSMCWLNIKENSFLLITLTTLFADLLSLSSDTEQFLIEPEELFQIGMKHITIMLRCRHKGVIEACAVSLTKFTRTLLRIQSYLHNCKNISSDVRRQYRKSQERFIENILTIVDLNRQSSFTSITRRSAGLALVVQSVLTGEAEAMLLDGIRMVEDENKQTLYEQIVYLLIRVAESPVQFSMDKIESLQLVDVAPANALHILQSIVKTASLSHLTYKTVEQMFSLCVEGFTSPLWQIRNASLQLFGSCVTRMLGQKKRTKTNEEEDFGVTITFEEFRSRYPLILDIINTQFGIHRDTLLCPMLVPILTLLASFTPPTQTVNLDNHRVLIQHLIHFLSNRIWKIRDLAAKSLANLLSLNDLEKFIFESLSKPTMGSNQVHGLLACVSILLELKMNQNPTAEIDRSSLQYCFKEHLRGNPILKSLSNSIFNKKRRHEEKIGDSEESGMMVENSCCQSAMPKHCCINSWLRSIREDISFRKSDDIRLSAANQMLSTVQLLSEHDLFSQMNCFETVENFVEVMLALFEDEDRNVRFVSHKITSTLCVKIDVKYKSKEDFCTNVSSHHFFGWLSLQTEWHSILSEIFLSKIAKFDFSTANPDHNVVVFEKEEKNVFAEPYMINMKIFAFLRNLPQEKLVLNKNQIEDLNLAIDFFQSNFIKNRNEFLLKQSIWRLPKAFCFLLNLYLTLQIASKQESLKYTGHLCQIERTFPFLQVLQSTFEDTSFENISVY